MYFYVDESGHTGANLFDEAQPMLYYGVLSSKVNVDLLAEPSIAHLRKKLGVNRLHANELGNGPLVKIAQDIVRIQKQLDFRFDLYRVRKPDHAIICFFDQVFDQGLNPAMTWTGYWTPLRYVLLLKIASLFDENLARCAWAARINLKDDAAQKNLVEICSVLITRLDQLQDARSQQLLGDALSWVVSNPAAVGYNTTDKKSILQVTPNIVGFQSVMLGIAGRIKKSKRQALKIVVDQQSQFNNAQQTLSDFYNAARNTELTLGPGMPKMDMKNMPVVPIEFSSSAASAGLELVDLHLWVFKRFMEKKDLAPELFALIKPHLYRGQMDEISLDAIAKRWTKYFEQVPELHEMSAEQVARGKEVIRIDENRRLKRIGGKFIDQSAMK